MVIEFLEPLKNPLYGRSDSDYASFVGLEPDGFQPKGIFVLEKLADKPKIHSPNYIEYCPSQ